MEKFYHCKLCLFKSCYYTNDIYIFPSNHNLFKDQNGNFDTQKAKMKNKMILLRSSK